MFSYLKIILIFALRKHDKDVVNSPGQFISSDMVNFLNVKLKEKVKQNFSIYSVYVF